MVKLLMGDTRYMFRQHMRLLHPTRIFLVVACLSYIATLPGKCESQSGSEPARLTPFDSQPWLADFHQLIEAMDSHYSDLEWAVNDRRMDLPKLRQQTEEKLRESGDNQSARRTLEQFLNAFGDGHLSIEWAQNDVSSHQLESGAVEPLCSRLGYKTSSKAGIDFSLLPGFAVVPGEGAELFSGGLLTLHGGKKLGLIRIASFNEHGFPMECSNTIREMHLSDASACDRDCAKTIALKTANSLTEAIVNRAEQLRSLGASALLIDVTRNDGGDDWNEAVARSLSSIPLVDERIGFIRYPTWTTNLESRLNDLESDLDKGAAPRSVLEEAAHKLRLAIAQSKEPCDRSRVFEDGSLNCSLVVKNILFWSGVLPYAKPGSFASLESKTTLFSPLRYEYTENAHRLPLYVAVDRHSWSSAERFAALLQDDGAATIIGELTGGAGCGFMNGGIPTTLTHSRARVKIPDCVGFRKDGSNANDGVTPDILVPWAARDTPYTKANKLLLYLEKVPLRSE
ncbi:MAG: S41 family peptidase [Acidobacteriaceae bacterium]